MFKKETIISYKGLMQQENNQVDIKQNTISLNVHIVITMFKLSIKRNNKNNRTKDYQSNYKLCKRYTYFRSSPLSAKKFESDYIKALQIRKRIQRYTND